MRRLIYGLLVAVPIYSCALIGTGTEGDPIRAPFLGDDPRIGWINLAPPGVPLGRGLLYLPTATGDPRIRKIADDPTERTTNGIRNLWQNELGITLQSSTTTSISALIAEILMDHGREDGTRWRGIRGFPSKQRHQWEIYLGALGAIWTQAAPPTPSTQSFSETWPTDSTTISSGQDQVWTEQENDSLVSGGKLTKAAGVAFGVVRCESALDTANQRHQADFTIVNGASRNQLRVTVRHSDGDNYYATNLTRNNGAFARSTIRRVAGVNTTLASDTSDPGASGTVEFIVDGTTVTLKINSVTILGPTTDGSPQLTTIMTGGALVENVGTQGDTTLDNHTIADVVSGRTTKNTRSAPLGVEVGMGWRM